jgi:hypothetical protein
MAHAAVKGNGHGKAWIKEIRRLVRLGAPLKTELLLYANNKIINSDQILGEFYGAGFEAGEVVSWQNVRFRLGYDSSLVDLEGRATNRACAQLLRKLQRQWLRGRREKRRIEKTKAEFLAKMEATRES